MWRLCMSADNRDAFAFLWSRMRILMRSVRSCVSSLSWVTLSCSPNAPFALWTEVRPSAGKICPTSVPGRARQGIRLLLELWSFSLKANLLKCWRTIFYYSYSFNMHLWICRTKSQQINAEMIDERVFMFGDCSRNIILSAPWGVQEQSKHQGKKNKKSQETVVELNRWPDRDAVLIEKL